MSESSARRPDRTDPTTPTPDARGTAATPPPQTTGAAGSTAPDPHPTEQKAAPTAPTAKRGRRGRKKMAAAAAGTGAAAGAVAAGPSRAAAHERFGGTNVGAACFGWLVAVGIAIILIGIVGAIGTAVGATNGLTFDGATDAATDASGGDANTFGLVAAIVVGAILALAYFTGGYVAGRMSRFDGARQGVAVWLVGLVVTILAGVVGALAGREYDVLDRVDLPSLQLTTDLTLAGVVAAVAILLVTALAAIGGGAAGRRYHDKVDRAAGTLV